MSNPWFRMYAEFATDPIAQSLSYEDQRHYLVVLCLKCQGVLDRNLTSENRRRIICRGLGLDPVEAEEVKTRLIEVEFIDETWQPLAWDKRQYKSDNSTGRTRKYRKTKKDGSVPETFEGTFHSVSVYVSENIYNYLIENNIDLDLWERFEKYRKTDLKKPLKTDQGRKKLINVLINHPPDKHEIIVQQTIDSEWTGLFAPKLEGGSHEQSRKPTKLERAMSAVQRSHVSNADGGDGQDAGATVEFLPGCGGSANGS